MNRIIINGRAGAGKDVIADYLVEEHGYVKVSFAEGIYKIARELFGMTTKDRELLIAIGQKMREIDPDVWVYSTFQRAVKHDKVVISDCRQANEYITGKSLGFFPVRVSSDWEIRRERLRKRDGVEPDMELLESKGETGADNFEYYEIENNSSFEDLYKKIDEMILNGRD